MKLLLLPLCAMAIAASAQDDSPLWLRHTVISPDGLTIAFTYHGDIFTVPVSGGTARQITSNPAYDTDPLWNPDGTELVFASDRQGSLDLFIVDAQGGTPRRLTTHSSNERPLVFLNDSTILYTAGYQVPTTTAAQGPFQSQTYQVSTKGGRPKLYASLPMGAANVDKQGRLLYQDKKGYENALRKHERSSGTSDIWLVEDGKYTKLTSFNGHDLNPTWAPGVDTFYYLSEQDGTLNVYSRTLQGQEQQLTKFDRHPVRHLSASNDGKLAFSWDGEIYTLTPGSEPQKVQVNIIADDYDADKVKGYRSNGASTMAVSPDGKQVAFVLRGDVYVTDTKYETTKRITNTDGQERVVSFSPDGRSLVYDGERDGIWQLFIAKIKNDDEKTFPYATEIEEELLYKSDKPAQQPAFSPDGKKVAFLEDRDEIRVIDVKSKAVNTALDGAYNYSYSDGDVSFEWSPDSRWLLTSYIGVGGWNNVDIALVKADGTEVVDLTESGYANSNPKWVLGGKGLTYESGRYGMKSHGSWGEQSDVLLMMLDGEAWDDFNSTEEEAALKEEADKEKKDKEEADSKDKKDKKDKKKKGAKEDDEDEVIPLEFDLKNRQYRTKRLTGVSSSLADYYVSPKGDKLYYIARNNEGKFDLYQRDLRKGDTKVIVPGIEGFALLADKEGENLFTMGDGMMKIAIPGGDVEPITFSALYSRTPSAEREYMYDHAWRQVRDKFYDPTIHGIDWEQYGKDYRKFLPYVNNNYDFSEVLSELLGELNASHTGSGYRTGGATTVATLGAIYDEDYVGDGLKVAEVIARGPLSTKKADVQPGDIIVSIDGEEILAGQDYFPMLEGKSGKKVRLGVKKPSGQVAYSEVKPIGSLYDLLYQRWVEHNEHVVDSISGGKIGYVHVEGMDSPSFREVYSKLLGKYRNCDAVVVDTRFNGGGWLHNDIALLLSGKEYVRYSPRGKYVGSDPFSQWTKPSVMLVSEGNYSDAHGTPYTYKTLGIGKLVGAPVPGTMTAVWWETLIDPSLYFGIPMVTSLDRNGKPLENQQLNPDIEVYNNPGDMLLGTDAQLIEATKSLMR
ncbi:MAG: PDZ domain-containing protein [Bacteroidales bacterium]|nr:PDZ domain-containing protein [Bacteroidales bacterium]